MAKTFIWFADGLVDAPDQLHRIVRLLDAGLNDRKFVAAEPGNEINLPDATAQARRDGFQQLVACGMTKGIADALEFIDVDVEHGKLLAPPGSLELALQLLAEQGAIRQIGQRVVVSKMPDLLLGAPARRDVLLSGNPSAIRQRPIDDLHRTAVRRLQHG